MKYQSLSNSNSSTKSQNNAIQFNIPKKKDFDQQPLDKEKLKDKSYMMDYLKNNSPNFLENFELIDYLNSGAAGIVYSGKFKQLNKPHKLAFKFITPKKSTEKKELTILKKLHHQKVIELYASTNMPNNSKILILDLAEYGDLINFQEKSLKRKIFSETMLCYFASQILDSLQYIHKRKIVHMDIKQGNILIDSFLNIKLTDFSVSLDYSNFHPLDIIKLPKVGTGKYISPEVLGGKHLKVKDIDKVDIFSLGITLYTMAFGNYPFNLDEIDGKNYDIIFSKIQNNTLEFPEKRKISALCKDFMRRLLEKEGKKRMNIIEAMNHPWIKGAKYIFEEKELINNIESFFANVVSDNILKFNDYVKGNV